MIFAKVKRFLRNNIIPSISYLEQQSQILIRKIDYLTEKDITLDNDIVNLKCEIEFKNNEIADLHQEIACLKIELDKLIKISDDLKQSNEKKESQITLQNRRLTGLENEYYDKIYSSWSCYGDNVFFIDEIKKSLHSPYCWDNYKPEYWMISFSILLNLNESDLVRKFLPKYVDLHGVTVIHQYLLVASFMYQNGYSDESLRKAFEVNTWLKNNRKNRFIENYFTGKTVAIVGNGSSEVGSGNGPEIDNHDVVIRFNNYQTDGYENDYGIKTNVWVRGSGGDDIIDREDVSSYDLIIWEADYDHFPVHFDNLDILHRYLSSGHKCCNYDFFEHFSLRKKSGIDFPSTGLLTLWTIANIVGINNINIYGFSFKENNPSFINEHYFHDRDYDESKGRTAVHDMSKEGEFILSLLIN